MGLCWFKSDVVLIKEFLASWCAATLL